MSIHPDLMLGTDRKEDPKDTIDTIPAVEEITFRGSHKVPEV